MDERDQARGLALLRVLLGAGFFLAPRLGVRAWTGEAVPSIGAVVAARGVGARDVAIGLGTLIALEHKGAIRGWLEAGVIADAADATSALFAGRRMSARRRFLFAVSGAASALLGARLASSFEQ